MKYYIEMSRWGEEWIREEGEFFSLEEADENIFVERWDKYSVRIVDENGAVHSHLVKWDEPLELAQSPDEVFEAIRNGYGFTVEEFETFCKQWLETPHTDEDDDE